MASNHHSGYTVVVYNFKTPLILTVVRNSKTSNNLMKGLIILLFTCTLLIPVSSFGQDSTKTEKALKVVPLITSSPLMGFGAGFAISYLYKVDNSEASKSQLQVGGQYSNTKSYALFIRNNAWFKNNNILSSTNILPSSINNEFKSEGNDVAYNVKTFLISELLLFRVTKNIYVGGPLTYKSLKYNANNQAGEDFIFKNGI